MIFNAGQRRGESGPKLPPVGQTLENYSWADIGAISKAGKAEEYFLVGDQKNIKINGVDYAVEIVGFNHDDLADGSGKAGITFGMVDSLSTYYPMNASNTNVNGWGGSVRRSELQTTVFAQLDADLQKVIKTVNKSTSAGNKSSTINIYADTLFLFSETELFGTTSYSVGSEGKQYAKFTTNASRIKKVNGTARSWWERSPRLSTSTEFCYVSATGTAGTNSASGNAGIAFGFCV